MRIVSFIFCIAFLTACKKEISPYDFTGKIRDQGNNPVSNATVELIAYYNSANAISPGGFYKLATTQTNNAGDFKVFFNQADGIKYYQVNVFAKDYFPFYANYIAISNFQNDNLTYNPLIYKLATIKISFKNTSPISSTDEFHVYQENELFGGGFDTFVERQFTGGTFNELEHKYVGSLIQGYEITKTKGNTYTFINWTSKKNGIINSKRDSIFIANALQGNYTINY